MKERCHKLDHKNYNDYGARGITVCDEWRNSFATFIHDMGPRPSPTHTIDRKDNEKGYSKDNCYWATRIEQANNKRSNRLFTINGETKTLKQWCDLKGLKYKSVHARMQRRNVPFLNALY